MLNLLYFSQNDILYHIFEISTNYVKKIAQMGDF